MSIETYKVIKKKKERERITTVRLRKSSNWRRRKCCCIILDTIARWCVVADSRLERTPGWASIEPRVLHPKEVALLLYRSIARGETSWAQATESSRSRSFTKSCLSLSYYLQSPLCPLYLCLLAPLSYPSLPLESSQTSLRGSPSPFVIPLLERISLFRRDKNSSLNSRRNRIKHRIRIQKIAAGEWKRETLAFSSPSFSIVDGPYDFGLLVSFVLFFFFLPPAADLLRPPLRFDGRREAPSSVEWRFNEGNLRGGGRGEHEHTR